MGHASAQNPQRSEEQPEFIDLGGGIKHHAPNAGDDQTENETVLIADFVDGITLGGGDEEIEKGNNEVGSKESKLNEVRLKLVEVKVCFELWE